MGRNVKLVLGGSAPVLGGAETPMWGPLAPPAPTPGVVGSYPHFPMESGVTHLPCAVSEGKEQLQKLERACAQPLPSFWMPVEIKQANSSLNSSFPPLFFFFFFFNSTLTSVIDMKHHNNESPDFLLPLPLLLPGYLLRSIYREVHETKCSEMLQQNGGGKEKRII